MVYNWFKNFKLQGTNLEIMRFAICVSFPIATMIWVGHDTHEKLNIPSFWPDPSRLHQIPKDPEELRAEIARMRQARLEKRKRLEEEAKNLGLHPPSLEHNEAQLRDLDEKDPAVHAGGVALALAEGTAETN